MDVIHTNVHLWKSVGGPDAEELFRPSAAKLELCKEVSERLEELKAKDERDGTQEFCEEHIKVKKHAHLHTRGRKPFHPPRAKTRTRRSKL